MRKGEVVPLDQIAAGMPVELVGNLEHFDNKTKFGVLQKVSKHFRPDMVFVNLDVLDSPRKGFVGRVIAVPKDSQMCKVLTGTAGTTLKGKMRSWQRQNLAPSLANGVYASLGSDPEIFVLDSKGALMPAFDFLPKKGYGVTAFWDGFQAEFTTQAGTCLAMHVDDIRKGLKAVLTAAREKDPKAKLTHEPVVEIPEKVLATCKQEYAALGCDPSKNIYGNMGQAVDDGRHLPVRFAGGHIHFGLPQASLRSDFADVIIKACDAITGVASVSLFAGIDSPLRRQYYGLAGEYRLPPHGLEWRTLSNAWLTHPAITHLVFDLARESTRFGYAGLMGLLKNAEPERIQDIINGGDVKASRAFIAKNKDIYCGLFKVIYNGTRGNDVFMTPVLQQQAIDHAFKTLESGIEYAVKDPTDICKNWLLDGNWTGHSAGKAAQWVKAAIQLNTGKKI